MSLKACIIFSPDAKSMMLQYETLVMAMVDDDDDDDDDNDDNDDNDDKDDGNDKDDDGVNANPRQCRHAETGR
jgi:hypothetical protein